MLADLAPDFELDHLELALEYCQNFRTAVDGGANIGIWTTALARRFEHVIAFEPVEENRLRIPGRPNVKVRSCALGREIGDTAIMAPGETNIGEWHIAATDAVHKPGREHQATIWPLDMFRIADLDFLKLDVEGYELFALQGARETIERCKPVICIEEKWHCERYGVPQGEATRYLEAMGYHVSARIGRDVILVA